MSRRTAEPIADPWQTSPTFVDGLAAMETIGSVTHLVFTARQTGAYEGAQRERVVQARLIVPTDQLPMIARQLLAGQVDPQVPVDEKGEPIGLQ